jgi:hypothetical protein
MYKDLTPRGVDELAKWLVEALAGGGYNIATAIEADEEAVLAKRQAYFESFASIQSAVAPRTAGAPRTAPPVTPTTPAHQGT